MLFGISKGISHFPPTELLREPRGVQRTTCVVRLLTAPVHMWLREGKIYEHSVDNVVLRDPPMGISPLWTSLQRIFTPQPQPLPGTLSLQQGAGPVRMLFRCSNSIRPTCRVGSTLNYPNRVGEGLNPIRQASLE